MFNDQDTSVFMLENLTVLWEPASVMDCSMSLFEFGCDLEKNGVYARNLIMVIMGKPMVCALLAVIMHPYFAHFYNHNKHLYM